MNSKIYSLEFYLQKHFINEIYNISFFKKWKRFNENFLLLGKEKYVILFDVEGTSLYTTNSMGLFLKLKPAKEQKLIKKKKKIK